MKVSHLKPQSEAYPGTIKVFCHMGSLLGQRTFVRSLPYHLPASEHHKAVIADKQYTVVLGYHPAKWLHILDRCRGQLKKNL
jgi:hypothetical protein